MIEIKGRIVDFLDKHDERDYSEFIFRSDSCNAQPRIRTLCAGILPDVVPGVPLKISFQVDNISQIKTLDFRDQRGYALLRDTEKEELMNPITDAHIDYQDEDYAREILLQVKGIARKTADCILDRVDGDLTMLADKWDDETFWKSIPRAKRYLPDLRETISTLLEMSTLFAKYSRYGIGYPQIERLASLYGTGAEEKLRDNPYIILSQLGLPFQVSDCLAKDLGFSYLDDRRVQAMIRNVLYQNESNGNTCMSQSDFYTACAWLHRESAWHDSVVSPYYILGVVTQMDTVNYECGYVGFMKTFNREVDICYQLRRLMEAPSALHISETVFEEIKGKYNEDQIRFLKEFDKQSVVLLLGRGGTGKTHTICGAIDLFKRKHPNDSVKLCAPTARAAGVLKEHSGQNASTIHVLLNLNPHTMAEDDMIQPLDARLIVVDEMSMVDTELMSMVLRAVQSGSKLILSGDPDQLESVGCGSVLNDMVRSGVVPQITLHKIMRQSEGSAVIENCGRVLNGRSELVENDHFKIHQCRTSEEALACFKSIYCGDSHTTQVLTTANKGVVGTYAINKYFSAASTKQDGIWIHHEYYKTGDKIIFTKNNYNAGYCNGDIGFIEVAAIPLCVKRQGDNQILCIESENLVDIKHADAITVHKSQGSEYQKVYIILPEEPVSMLTQNIVNTAISRARQDVELIVVGNALRVAVSNRFKRNRTTRLDVLLKEIKAQKMAVQAQPDTRILHSDTPEAHQQTFIA